MIIDKKEIPVLKNFKDIIFNDNSYIGYYNKDNLLHVFSVCDTKNYVFF